MKKLAIIIFFCVTLPAVFTAKGQNMGGEQECTNPETGEKFAWWGSSCDDACWDDVSGEYISCKELEELEVCACSYCGQYPCNYGDCPNKNCPRWLCLCPYCGGRFTCGMHDCHIPPTPPSPPSGGGGGGGGSPKYDCNGTLNGTAYRDNCNVCVGGTTGRSPCVKDCNNTWGGTAYIDNCNICVGGTTGRSPCVKDCNNVWGGTAYYDICGHCIGGLTGQTDCLDEMYDYCNPNSADYTPEYCNLECAAFTVLWNNSFSSTGTRTETIGFILYDDSYYILDNSGNTATTGSTNVAVSIGGVPHATMPDGTYKEIRAIIHTHPNHESNFNQEPDGDDFPTLEALGGKNHPIVGYVISTNLVYKYYFDKNGVGVVEEFGSRNNLSNCQ